MEAQKQPSLRALPLGTASAALIPTDDFSRLVHSLGQLEDAEAAEALVQYAVWGVLFGGDTGKRHAQWAAVQLGKLGSHASEPVARRLHSKAAPVRAWAARTLGLIGDPRAVELLTRRLDVRSLVFSAIRLGDWETVLSGGPEVVAPLCELLWASEPVVRKSAATILGHHGSREALPAVNRRLRPFFGETAHDVREALMWARKQIEAKTMGSTHLPRSAGAGPDGTALPRCVDTELSGYQRPRLGHSLRGGDEPGTMG